MNVILIFYYFNNLISVFIVVELFLKLVKKYNLKIKSFAKTLGWNLKYLENIIKMGTENK